MPKRAAAAVWLTPLKPFSKYPLVPHCSRIEAALRVPASSKVEPGRPYVQLAIAVGSSKRDCSTMKTWPIGQRSRFPTMIGGTPPALAVARLCSNSANVVGILMPSRFMVALL